MDNVLLLDFLSVDQNNPIERVGHAETIKTFRNCVRFNDHLQLYRYLKNYRPIEGIDTFYFLGHGIVNRNRIQMGLGNGNVDIPFIPWGIIADLLRDIFLRDNNLTVNFMAVCNTNALNPFFEDAPFCRTFLGTNRPTNTLQRPLLLYKDHFGNYESFVNTIDVSERSLYFTRSI